MRKIIKIFGVFCLLSILLMQQVYGAELSDISNHENQTAIQYLYDNDVISGYPDGLFKPSNTVNRAELLKILVGGKGMQPAIDEGYKNCFPDVKEEWFAPFVCYAKEQGWVGGYPDGTFQPGKTVIKVEAIKMLINSQGYMIPSVVSGVVYNDVDNTAWYAPYIKIAKDKGLLEEDGATFGTTAYMKRANISENIYRAMIIKEETLSSFDEYSNTISTNDDSLETIEEVNVIPEETEVVTEFDISGSGTNVSEKFDLKQGLVIVEANHTGSSNFITTLLDSDGKRVEGITNAIGNFSGKTAFEIPSDGEYLMNVKADGSWSFHFEQPVPASNTEEKSTFSGEGVLVSDFFKANEDELVVFSFSHDGDSNFIAEILDEDGDNKMYIVNEIGEISGSTAEYLEKGIYLLKINADGNWTMKYEKLNTNDVSSKSSFSGTGKAATPLFSMSSGLKVFNFTHEGSSNFIVHLYDEKGNSVAYLTNEIGDFSGSTAESIDNGIYILNVDADGDWTIDIE